MHKYSLDYMGRYVEFYPLRSLTESERNDIRTILRNSPSRNLLTYEGVYPRKMSDPDLVKDQTGEVIVYTGRGYRVQSFQVETDSYYIRCYWYFADSLDLDLDARRTLMEVWAYVDNLGILVYTYQDLAKHFEEQNKLAKV